MWELYPQKVSSKENGCSQIKKKKDGFGGRLVTHDPAKKSRNIF